MGCLLSKKKWQQNLGVKLKNKRRVMFNIWFMSDCCNVQGNERSSVFIRHTSVLRSKPSIQRNIFSKLSLAVNNFLFNFQWKTSVNVRLLEKSLNGRENAASLHIWRLFGQWLFNACWRYHVCFCFSIFC